MLDNATVMLIIKNKTRYVFVKVYLPLCLIYHVYAKLHYSELLILIITVFVNPDISYILTVVLSVIILVLPVYNLQIMIA
jgi:hypothetical protein